MKTPFKNVTLTGLAALGLALAGSAQAQVPITNVINTFDTSDSGCGEEWGSGTVAWDGTQGEPAGSLLLTLNFGNSSDTPAVAYCCLDGGNPWYQPQTMNVSSYQNIEFDVLYDATSDITIPEFNDLSTWPTDLTNSSGQTVFISWAGAGYLAGSTPGFDVELCGGPAGQLGPFIATWTVPAAAATNWVHVKIPINQSESQIDGVNGIAFHKWINQQWGIQNTAVARLWIDNLVLTGTAAPPPPPKLSTPVKAVQGLNVFASSEGNSYYDRQEAELMQGSGLSWVGQATTANPVTYSFDIVGYPNSVNCEAYLFLVPNPDANDGAPDWNETNCAIFYLQGNTHTVTAHFQYKVNENDQQAMYSGGNEARGYYTNAPGSWDGVTTNYLESGNLAALTTSSGVMGTWTLQFTSDTNGTIIAPNGASTNFVIPPYNIGYFAETAAPGFNLYLGMQANQADAMNQAVTYANFAVSNTAAPFSEDFTADTVLDTTNVWRTSVSGGPAGVLIVPTNSALWVDWTLPDGGFSLQAAPVLNNLLAWTTPTTGPLIPLYGMRAQLVASNEVPAGNAAFFQLIKRQFTQLEVLLPGETNAPNSPTGKGGSPTPVTAGYPVSVTVNAVDPTFHIVNSADTISLASSDSSAALPSNAQMSGGTATMTIYFGTTGSWTVTATDVTSTNIPPATSSSITAQ
jgi:hypothetical protein